jgi:hypothetical protein
LCVAELICDDKPPIFVALQKPERAKPPLTEPSFRVKSQPLHDALELAGGAGLVLEKIELVYRGTRSEHSFRFGLLELGMHHKGAWPLEELTGLFGLRSVELKASVLQGILHVALSATGDEQPELEVGKRRLRLDELRSQRADLEKKPMDERVRISKLAEIDKQVNSLQQQSAAYEATHPEKMSFTLSRIVDKYIQVPVVVVHATRASASSDSQSR